VSLLRLTGIAALLAVLAVPAAAFAQQAPPVPVATAMPGAPNAVPHRHRRNRLRTALAGLNLSAAQKSQIDQAFAQTREANRNADPATRKANRTQLRSRIDAILTPEQRAQLNSALHRGRRAV
jgi:Spy/CpxP family protein refolding chaperone